MNRYFAFTYLEIVIVIAVIGILASFGYTAYPGVQKSSRDTRRKSDLKQYQTALEGFAQRIGGYYPSSEDGVISASDLGGGTNLCTSIGLSDCPADPRAGRYECVTGECNYYFVSNGSGGSTASQYVLFAGLERKVDDKEVYFVVCSGGETGTKDASSWTPTNSTCPL